MNLGRILVVIILVALGLSGCASKDGRFYPWWAKPPSLDFTPPPGPPEFQQGFRDGCESGFKGYSQHYNKIWWKFRQDPDLRNNPVYYKIWKDAYSHCAAFANSIADQGIGHYTNRGLFPWGN